MKFTDRPVSPQDSAVVFLCLGMTTLFFFNVVESIPAFQLNPASTQDEAIVSYIGPEERTGFLNRLTTLLFTMALFC